MPKKNRDDWIRAGLRRLARKGVEAVRVEPLARQLGVTKGSFYWHFRDRAELLDALLEEWAETATEAIIVRSEAAGSDPRARLERLTGLATDHFDAELELALRDWGRHDPSARRVLDEVDGRRMSYLRQLLRESGFDAPEAEARTFLIYSALFGHSLLPDSHGRFSRKRVLSEALELLYARGRGG
jgi:AcrR family transcriptional regulator